MTMLLSLIFSLLPTFLMSFFMFNTVVSYVLFLLHQGGPTIKININVSPIDKMTIQQLESKTISAINKHFESTIFLVFSSGFIVFCNWIAPKVAQSTPSVFTPENVSLISTVTNFTGLFLQLVPLLFSFSAGFIHSSKASFLRKLDDSSQEQDMRIAGLLDMLTEEQNDIKFSVEYYLDTVSQQGRSLTFAEAECIIEKLKTCTVDTSVDKGAGTGTFSA